jgi:hypothetical protein
VNDEFGGERTMSQRNTNLLWLRDMLEHLSASQKQLEWTDDAETVRLLTDSMLRDLERCQRVCETLRQRCGVGHAV